MRLPPKDQMELALKAKFGRIDTEFKFHHFRKWRFDFAVPSLFIAFEFDGSVFAKSRHTSGPGFTADCEKTNSAALLGWRVFRFTSDHFRVKKNKTKSHFMEILEQL